MQTEWSTVRPREWGSAPSPSRPVAVPAPASPAAAPGAWAAWFLVATAATVVYFFLPEGPQSLLYNGIGIAAAAVMLLGVAIQRLEPRPAWILLSLSVGTLAVGDVFYGKFQHVPSVADMFYLSGHVAFASALVLLMRRSLPRHRRPALIDAVGITAAVMGATLVFLNSVDGQTGAATGAVSMAYPALDVIALGFALRLALVSEMGNRRHWLLVGGLVLMFAADAGYALQGFGDDYVLGGGLDAGWLVSYALFGAALLHPGDAARRGSGDRVHDADAFVPSSGVVVLQAVRLRGVLGWGGAISMGVAAVSMLLGVAWQAPEALFAGGVYGTVGTLMVFASAVHGRR